MADQPWHELPPEIVGVLRPALADVAHEMMEAVATVPAYARPLEGPFGDGLRDGVQEALRHLLAEIEAGGHVDRARRLPALGRGEMRAGRSLESLLSAYRVGARVAWRRFAARRRARPASSPRRCICWPSRSSPTSTCSRPSRPRATRSSSRPRRARPSCAGAGWCACSCASRRPSPGRSRRPRAKPAGNCRGRLAVLAIPGERARPAASRLPQGDRRDDRRAGARSCPTPMAPGGRGGDRAGDRGCRRERSARDPSSGRTRDSFARARAALALADGAPSLILAREQAGELLLLSDRALAAELAADRLAPLAELSARARARGSPTPCKAWLAEQGRLAPWRRAARCHPQTVRYRLAGCGSCSATRSTIPTSGSGSSWRCAWSTATRRPASARYAAACGSGWGAGAGSGGIATDGPRPPSTSSSSWTSSSTCDHVEATAHDRRIA